MSDFFICDGRGLNSGPSIYYALSISTELNSRGHMSKFLCIKQNACKKMNKKKIKIHVNITNNRVIISPKK